MKRKSFNVESNDMSDIERLSDDQYISDPDSELEKERIDDNGEVEENGNLDSSATNTDEESDTDSGNGEDEPKKSKNEQIREKMIERYQKRHGKQLYLRFPHKIAETQDALEEKVRELSPLVTKVHKPRQRYARFCLIDFASKEDRDVALKKLKKSIKEGDLRKYVVDIPRTESTDFVKELTERKIKSVENRKAKQRLKKATKKSLKETNFTSTVVVFNLPQNAAVLEIRKLFPNAVDINIKPGKGKLNAGKSIAAITFPTTFDARNAIKKNLSLGGNKLFIKFDNKSLKKNSRKIVDTKNMANNDELSEEMKPIDNNIKSNAAIPDSEEHISIGGPVHKPNKKKVKKSVKNKAK